ncbi:MAG: AAA family ATPase [Verrucomicrobiota bacterium]
MIASVAFRNFKALRNTRLDLLPFNLVIGANGSGKTSLIQAMLRLRALARLPLRQPDDRLPDAAEISFRFQPPHDGLEAVLGCVSDTACDLLQIIPLPAGDGFDDPDGLRARLAGIRAYLFDHYAMALPSPVLGGDAELSPDGANLSGVLAARREHAPDDFAVLRAEVLRLFPEYDDLDLATTADGRSHLRLRLAGEGSRITADALSQGTLYALALLTLACDSRPPGLICIEEVDRGIHPRLLREIRDALYRLSHPAATGLQREPVQVIATTHSPYLLDLFKDHPEEIVIAEKHGRAATFSRLTDRADLAELLTDGSLGDLWFSGILGGVPDES